MNDFIGIPDNEFIRGNVPMTKFEIRMITISKLRLKQTDIIADIGAGTGSISVEIARVLNGGKVFSIESTPEGIELTRKNCDKFGITNISLVYGTAPDALSGIAEVDGVVIGGSGGRLEGIIDWANGNIKPGGRIVINSITFDTLVMSKKMLEERDFNGTEIIQAGINKFEPAGKTLMLKSNNPVFIISATRK